MASKTNYLQLFSIFLLLLVFFASSAAYGQDEELLLSNPDTYPCKCKQRAAVTFSHELHMEEFECLECHHDYADGENILDEDELEEGNPDIRCAACHGADLGTDAKRAYHRQCMGCHRNMRSGGLSTGPELCGECHPK